MRAASCRCCVTLREDEAVAGVILHVTSPGGSAHASDLLWREVQRLAEDKPVVACFGDVSASGGFYLSAPAARIVARATTLTGSIGVFGGKLVLRGTARHLGVRSQALTAEGARHAAMFSGLRPFSDSERARFRASLQRTYDGFVQRVADGRGQDLEAVEPLCRGRVWLGDAAAERGLIDEVGGLPVALATLARELKVDVPRLRVTHQAPKPPQPLAELAMKAARQQAPGAMAAWLAVLPEADPTVQALLTEPGLPLALCPGLPRIR